MTYTAEWMKDSWTLSSCCWHSYCTEEMWHHVWPWSDTKISANHENVHLIHQSTNVVWLHLVPAALPHIRFVDRLRVFYHDPFFTTVNSVIQCIDAFLSTVKITTCITTTTACCFAVRTHYTRYVNFHTERQKKQDKTKTLWQVTLLGRLFCKVRENQSSFDGFKHIGKSSSSMSQRLVCQHFSIEQQHVKYAYHWLISQSICTSLDVKIFTLWCWK